MMVMIGAVKKDHVGIALNLEIQISEDSDLETTQLLLHNSNTKSAATVTSDPFLQ